MTINRIDPGEEKYLLHLCLLPSLLRIPERPLQTIMGSTFANELHAKLISHPSPTHDFDT